MRCRIQSIACSLFVVACLIVFIPACGDDDSPTEPDAGDQGTVIIDPSPDVVAPQWSLAGPDDYAMSGTGDRDLNGLAPGEYSVNWHDVDGLVTPPDETGTLVAAGTLRFAATYHEPGTLVIDPRPDTIAAPWSVTGPDEFTAAGTGLATLDDLAPGEYQLVWGDVADHVTPPPASRTLAAGEVATWRASYAQLVTLAAGSFTMGSPAGEPGRSADEVAHDVQLTSPFAVFACEVTNQQYVELAAWALAQGFCNVIDEGLYDATDYSADLFLVLNAATSEISFADGVFTVAAGKQDHPVSEVTWHGAAVFCNWLSLRAGLAPTYDQDSWECAGLDPYDATGYRLPTEAEWEYACRAGSETAFANGEITETGCGDPVLALIGRHCGDGIDAAADVGTLLTNDWDLLDLHGNVFEWCHDRYGPYAGDAVDPVGAASGLNRVIRGGAWSSQARFCRSASRGDFTPFHHATSIGFRPVVGR